MLEVSDLKMNFAGLAAVSSVSFSVSKGEIVSMIGPNGAGKTTVFNMITGFYSPSGGSIRFEKQELRGLPPHRIARLGVARTFQNIQLFGEMTVEANMRVACQCHSPVSLAGAVFRSATTRFREREETKRIGELIEAVGLGHNLSLLASQLSYGEQRRLEIARALATEAHLLLLDEPTAGMSATEVDEILRLIGSLRKLGITVFLIEHNMSLVMRVSDRIVVLDHGVKIAEGRPEEVQLDNRVRQAYLGEFVQ
jgi:branched-chain amino acid transport system ATP-binding protein